MEPKIEITQEPATVLDYILNNWDESQYIKGRAARYRHTDAAGNESPGGTSDPTHPESAYFCAVGIIDWACAKLGYRDIETSDLIRYLLDRELPPDSPGKDPGSRVVVWNDRPERTFADVTALFQAARAKGSP